jgi:hypothetical protein
MSAYKDTVKLVKELGGERASYFHLSRCACGQPSWQQPCPLCGYYPYGNDPEERERCRRQGLTKEHWLRRVASHGSIGAWYFSGLKNTVAWAEDTGDFRAKVEALIAKAESAEWPDPSEVYDEVVSPRRS